MLYMKATSRVERRRVRKPQSRHKTVVRLTDQHLQKSVPLTEAVKFVN